MAGASRDKPSRQRQQQSDEPKDFSNRYPGGEQIEGGGEWFEFAEVGDELVGVYMGTEAFKNGFKGTIETKDGTRVFSAATLLRQKLGKVRVGDSIAIILAGFQPSDKQSPLKVYQVFRVPNK